MMKKIQYENGNLYEGEIDENGLPNGNGRLIFDELVYIGSFKKGKFDGKGTIYDEYGRVFEGTFQNGLKNGEGTLYGESGFAVYDGNWKDDKREGYGSEYIGSSIVYEGYFSADRYEGYGKTFDCDGEILQEGYFHADRYVGEKPIE
jgi:antitoxin component YwqK of YwqJK toxin-antitoxin module